MRIRLCLISACARLQFREERYLEREGPVALSPWQGNRRLPALALAPGIQLHIRPDPLQHLYPELILRRAAGDEVLWRLLVQIFQLDPLVAGKMIRQPRLSALGFASDPIAQDISLVRVRLFLDRLRILVASALADQRRAVC